MQCECNLDMISNLLTYCTTVKFEHYITFWGLRVTWTQDSLIPIQFPSSLKVLYCLADNNRDINQHLCQLQLKSELAAVVVSAYTVCLVCILFRVFKLCWLEWGHCYRGHLHSCFQLAFNLSMSSMWPTSGYSWSFLFLLCNECFTVFI